MATRTIIQGYEPENIPQGNVGTNSMYSRRVPQSAMPPQSAQPQLAPQSPVSVLSDKPVVGFAYTVSRSMAAEYWPLHIGRNSIGRAADNDIVLSEGTVSEHHAEIVIQQLKNPVKIAVLLKDNASTVGTLLNGANVYGSQTPECHNGDIVTVGDNYELYLVLLDAASLGLAPKPGFVPVEASAVAPAPAAAPTAAPAAAPTAAPVAAPVAAPQPATASPNQYIPQAPEFNIYSAPRTNKGTMIG